MITYLGRKVFKRHVQNSRLSEKNQINGYSSCISKRYAYYLYFGLTLKHKARSIYGVSTQYNLRFYSLESITYLRTCFKDLLKDQCISFDCKIERIYYNFKTLFKNSSNISHSMIKRENLI